jgi:hypothetical protein
LNLCHHENLKSHTHSTRLAMLMLWSHQKTFHWNSTA